MRRATGGEQPLSLIDAVLSNNKIQHTLPLPRTLDQLSQVAWISSGDSTVYVYTRVCVDMSVFDEN